MASKWTTIPRTHRRQFNPEDVSHFEATWLNGWIRNLPRYLFLEVIFSFIFLQKGGKGRKRNFDKQRLMIRLKRLRSFLSFWEHMNFNMKSIYDVFLDPYEFKTETVEKNLLVHLGSSLDLPNLSSFQSTKTGNSHCWHV